MRAIRRKPVMRDEVRLGDWVIAGDKLRIITIPADAVEDGELIERLWAPLLTELAAEAARRRRKKWKLWSRAFDGRVPPDRGYVAGSEHVPFRRWAKPYADYDPRPAAPWFKPVRTCARCASEFYGGPFSRYCSDKCADAVRAEQRAAHTKRRSDDRAPRRNDHCTYCNAPMTAARSTKQLCSPRCRAAWHRL
jgi:hypothetical protein